jgi:hypothetical protein
MDQPQAGRASRRSVVMNHVRALWQRRPLRIAAVVLIVVALVLVAVPMRPADSVSVTTQYSPYGFGPSEQIFATVIHDGATVGKVHEIFDAASGPIIPPRGAFCPFYADKVYTYDFTFTWRGHTTESVHWFLYNCPHIEITRWGNPFILSYVDLSQSQYNELVRLTGIPVDPRYDTSP